MSFARVLYATVKRVCGDEGPHPITEQGRMAFLGRKRERSQVGNGHCGHEA